MKKILLYSGGMDSWLIKELWKPDECVFVDAGTQYGYSERRRLPKGITLIEGLKLQQWERKDKIIPLRNLYFIMACCNKFPEDDLQIALGATAGDRVLDKSKEFAEKASGMLSFLYQQQWWCEGRKVEVVLPYKSYTKEMLLNEYKETGGNLETAFNESFSCYHPTLNGQAECWECKPCIRKVIAFWLVGFKKIKISVLKAVWTRVHEDIVPQIEEGKYGRGEQEEKGIVQFHNEIKEVLKDWSEVEKSFDYGDIEEKIAEFKKKWGDELVLK